MAIRSPPDPSGGGQCFALLRMRIATSGSALLAMTVVIGGWSFYFGCSVVQTGRRGQCRPPYSPISIRRANTSDRSGGFTRLPSSKTHQSRVWLRALPGGFIKKLVYFLCKVCFTVISVRRDGQTRAEKKRNTRAFCGQRDHLPDDSGSKGMALAA